MATSTTAPSLPYSLAAAAAWAASLLVMAALGVLHGGIPAWIQSLIYLLAAVPLAMGVTGILRYRWFGNHAAYRRGLYFVVVGWALAVHGWFKVRAHQADVAAREEALRPVISALERYHRQYGTYPETLDNLGVEARDAGPVAYAKFGDGEYLLAFRHDVIVQHRYDAASGRWRDAL
jgi:hypothetical protein